ncbi:hypothetical protein MKW92_041384 [Papaver armeniacum]|nr:hypothetical protein MKW92_041384 [Papaver armeniacum]
MEFHHQSLVRLLFLISIQFTTTLSCHEHERTSLLAFRSLLTDPSNRLSSWQGNNCCDNWHGIHCSNHSLHVVSVDLRNPDPETFIRNFGSTIVSTSSTTALNGTISPLLFGLIHLEYLDLSYNHFNFSSISSNHFSKLKRLTYLELSHSMFSGSITTQFANLSSLRYLDISCSSRIIDYSTYSYNFDTSKFEFEYEDSYFSTSYVSSTNLNWLSGLVNLEVVRLVGVDLSMASSAMNWAEPLLFLSNLRELDVSDCSLSGLVFPVHDFRNLSLLASLRMSSNSFNSPIPFQFTNFTSLSVLDLENCNLHGSMPHLPHLKELYVSGNKNLNISLSCFFSKGWPQLQVLSMQLTDVNGSIPSSISNVSSLVSLDMSGCAIKGSIPASVTNLLQLQNLDLSDNNITGRIPFSISKLKNLQILSLSQNDLQGVIPESICDISSLREINLGSNNLTGTLPGCINKLRKLERIFIGDNSIEGTISLISLINELSLTWIRLYSNNITVEMDEDVALSKFGLQVLSLQACNLQGYIPTFICDLPQLFGLDLSGNSLQGAIPSCIFELPNLSYLDLSRNNLQGTIPHSIQLTLQFPYLNLAKNNLGGRLPIPPQNIGVFDLSHNNFTGAISIEIGKRLCSIEYVSLSDNKLSGSIPSSICPNELNPLMHLDLSNNGLSDSIPSSLQYCNSLVSLNLGMNNLTGDVPDELLGMKNLKILLLDNNILSGTFPTFIQKLQELEVLNLRGNKFKGAIPTFIGALQNFKIIVLSSNEFNGSIPTEISHLHNLQILDISKNKLSGKLPNTIGSLEMLKERPNNRILLGEEISFRYSGVQLQMVTKGTTQHYELVYSYNSGIDLSCNFLEGIIPPEMGQLKGLAMLNISHNHFYGEIPLSIGSMIGLESLDLSFNRLSGDIPSSLTSIDSLGYLNLSYNNLEGTIPRGYHFDTLSLDGSAYIGNALLCGFPTNKSCEDDLNSTDTTNSLPNEEMEANARDKRVLYGIIFLGYGVGLSGLFLVLVIKKDKWWYGYWRFVDTVVLKITGFQSTKY